MLPDYNVNIEFVIKNLFNYLFLFKIIEFDTKIALLNQIYKLNSSFDKNYLIKQTKFMILKKISNVNKNIYLQILI